MEPKDRPSPPTRRRGIASTPTSKASRKTTLLLLGGGVLCAVGLVVGYMLFISEKNRRHAYPISWPRSAPLGDPVRILHEVKAGDVFTTTTQSNASFVLSVESVDPKDAGMKFDVKYATTHTVEPREGGLRSKVALTIQRADATYPPLKEAVWRFLGPREATAGYVVSFDREASGRPVPGTVVETGGLPKMQRLVLDGIVSGLGDLATDWLPGRDVRIGEVWPMASCAAIPNVVEVIKQVAEATRSGGYPEAKLRAEVAAEGIEFKDTEECLRLRLVLYYTMEGDAKEPAAPGWISTAAFVDGHVWVSTTTGIPWASELDAGVTSTYAITGKSTERRAIQKIVSKTVRGTEGVAPSK